MQLNLWKNDIVFRFWRFCLQMLMVGGMGLKFFARKCIVSLQNKNSGFYFYPKFNPSLIFSVFYSGVFRCVPGKVILLRMHRTASQVIRKLLELGDETGQSESQYQKVPEVAG